MVLETGLLVGGISIVTACVQKFKFYIKRNGQVTWGCGFQDKPLVDDDEFDVRVAELGDVKVLYVKPKHASHESDNE